MTVSVEKAFTITNGRQKHTKATKPGKVPHISRLLALALQYDQMLRSGTIPDFNSLCRYAGVTKPRMTQILNLLNLAPDIQTTILALPLIHQSRGPITERKLRPIVQVSNWALQREALNTSESKTRTDLLV